MTDGIPILRHTVLDCLEPRRLAEFYRQLLGYDYRPGHETPREGEDWLVLRDPAGRAGIAFQLVDEMTRPTWPDPAVPQQLHFDMTVSDKDELDAQHVRVLELGGELLLDGSDNEEEPIRVYADPAGHPFCIFVWAQPPT
jgi:hypothetical protein